MIYRCTEPVRCRLLQLLTSTLLFAASGLLTQAGAQNDIISTHDNLTPAGTLVGGTFSLELVVEEGMWYPGGENSVGIPMYAFLGTTYAGYSKTTDSSGQALFTLPVGEYRFRADVGGQQYFSDVLTGSTCTIPGCKVVSMQIGGSTTNTPTPTMTITPSPTLTPSRTATPSNTPTWF